MFLVYDIIFLIFSILYFPVLCLKGKWHNLSLFRFGAIPGKIKLNLENKKNIWVHAVSVGEVLAIADLIKRLKRRFPSHQIVLSTVTKTGFTLAQQQLQDQCLVIYAPFDFSFTVRSYIRQINPEIYVCTETEIWPNLFSALSSQKVPIIIVNGRISDRAYERYKKVAFLTKRVLGPVSFFGVQSPLDAQRIISMGADAANVKVLGNLKFDSSSQMMTHAKEEFNLKSDHQVFIAGSTHPGEEEILLEIYKNLTKEFPDLRHIIAPRHVERTKELIGIIEKNQLKPVLLSQVTYSDIDARSIIVVNTIGDLRKLYSIATAVFVGKTFCVGGGQNMIEPAFYGKPTFVGPKTENFKDIMRILLDDRAIIQVQTPAQMQEKLFQLLKSPAELEAIGKRAQGIIHQHQGATEKTLKVIEDLLKK